MLLSTMSEAHQQNDPALPLEKIAMLDSNHRTQLKSKVLLVKTPTRVTSVPRQRTLLKDGSLDAHRLRWYCSREFCALRASRMLHVTKFDELGSFQVADGDLQMAAGLEVAYHPATKAS
jgi:hypothetical protein